MTGYQTFGAAGGHSKSVEKLCALALPALRGAKVLDVGCNEGFFCGYAVARGATKVVGIDRDAGVIKAAQRRFPGATFLAVGWDALPEGQFDVVLLLSALHYAADQEALLHALMTRVVPDGLLVVEAGIAPGSGDEWVEILRLDGPKWYATRRRMERVLSRYAYKMIGPSVDQQGDRVARSVFHVRHMKPTVLLLSSGSYTGKSTLARSFAAAGIEVRSLDDTLVSMFDYPPNGRLGEAVRSLLLVCNPSLQGKLVVEELFDKGLGGDLLALAMAGASAGLTVLDGCLPEGSEEDVARMLEARGWIVWSAASPFPRGAHNVESTGGTVLTVGGDLAFRSEDSAQVAVDAASVRDGILSVAGWAVDLGTRCAVLQLALLVSGAEVPAVALRRVHRKDLSELGIAEDDCEAGFELSARLGSEEAAAVLDGASRVSIVALVAGSRATVADVSLHAFAHP